MGKQLDLLQGTLDVMILKAISLGPFTAMAFCFAFNRSQAINWKSSRARCIRPSIGWSIRA